jgi:hypothetical protein
LTNFRVSLGEFMHRLNCPRSKINIRIEHYVEIRKTRRRSNCYIVSPSVAKITRHTNIENSAVIDNIRIVNLSEIVD